MTVALINNSYLFIDLPEQIPLLTSMARINVFSNALEQMFTVRLIFLPISPVLGIHGYYALFQAPSNSLPGHAATVPKPFLIFCAVCPRLSPVIVSIFKAYIRTNTKQKVKTVMLHGTNWPVTIYAAQRKSPHSDS